MAAGDRRAIQIPNPRTYTGRVMGGLPDGTTPELPNAIEVGDDEIAVFETPSVEVLNATGGARNFQAESYLNPQGVATMRITLT